MSTEAPGLRERAPTPAQMRTFALLSALYIALTLALVPWAKLPGPSDPHIVVVYALGILVADLCTALMLGALYRGSRRSAHLVLGCAYLYSGLMAGAHMASFPGALLGAKGDVLVRLDGREVEAGIFGNEQTVSWVFLAWRLGTAALFLAALFLARRDAGVQEARPGRRLLVAYAVTVAAAATVIALAAQVRVEGIVGGRFTELGTQIQWGAVVLYAAAFALLSGKRAFGDLLYLWVGLVLVASIADLTLSNLGAARYTIGWHAACVNLSVSACLLLAFLLGDAADESRAMAKVAGNAAYGGAVALTLTAVLVRWALDPWLGFDVPYATLYGAVAIAVWFGGLGPAVMAMVLGYAIINVRYISPYGELAMNGPADAIGLALFALSSSLIIVLGEAMRRTRDRYRASEVELKERAAQLQRADAKKSQFLAVLSHELRNPLAPLLNGLALLRMQQPREDAASAETRDMMERQIVQLTRLIDDLLDVSRVDRGKLELRTEPVAIAAVMRTGVETAKPNIDAKGHSLAVSCPEAPLHVQGDPVRLAQVVANLLNNAAKFTPPKGRIELSACAEDGRVVLRVADNGIGIAPARHEARRRVGRPRPRPDARARHRAPPPRRDRGGEPRARQRRRVHRAPAARERARGGAARARARRGAGAPARAGGRRQRRCRADARPVPQAHRPPGGERARRRGGAAHRRGAPPRRRLHRPQHAEDGRRRGGAAPAPHALGPQRAPRRAHRHGPAGRHRAHARSRLRRAHHQAGGSAAAVAVSRGSLKKIGVRARFFF